VSIACPDSKANKGAYRLISRKESSSTFSEGTNECFLYYICSMFISNFRYVIACVYVYVAVLVAAPVYWSLRRDGKLKECDLVYILQVKKLSRSE